MGYSRRNSVGMGGSVARSRNGTQIGSSVLERERERNKRMATVLTWQRRPDLSAYHTASLMLAGEPLIDANLMKALEHPIQELHQFLSDMPFAAAEFMQRVLVPLAPLTDSPRQLADQALIKQLGSQRRAGRSSDELMQCLSKLRDRFSQQVPDLANSLVFREQPLKQQWEAYGPGLLHIVGQRTTPNLVVEQATVYLLHPVQGGGGEPHLSHNSVRIEGLLANAHEQLPEVLRLAWMLAQLNNDLPMHSEEISGSRLSRVSGLAMIPPVLTAAAELQLCSFGSSELTTTIQAWHLPVISADQAASVVKEWWEIYAATRPAWIIAMTALDRMLGDNAS